MPAIIKGNQHFQAITYVGNGGIQTIEVGFKVGLLWIKSRSAATDNKIIDIVRGATKALITNTNGAETTDTNGVTAFTNTGFTLGSDSVYNTAGATYVAWCWKAGDSTVTNTAGTIASLVSANLTAGFSIVSYTGTGANATVGHGLIDVPKFVVVKRTNTTESWLAYHSGLSNAVYCLLLNGTQAQTSASAVWNSSPPLSSVFSVGTDTGTNASGSTYVAYCWSEIPGYSAFGSYTANGSADGPMIYTNFKPKFIMFKSISIASSWRIIDTTRDSYNLTTKEIYPNAITAESIFNTLDVLSNGFKLRNTDSGYNSSGTYIYAAFAENPFAYANAR